MAADTFFRRWTKAPDERPVANAVADVARVPEAAPDSAQVPTGDGALDARNVDAVFLRRDADPALRRAALKRLFADPHFGKPDGLDVYMDDYNALVPLDAAMLASLDHAASLFKSRDVARAEIDLPAEAIPAVREGAGTHGAESDAGTASSPARDDDAVTNAPAGLRSVPPTLDPAP